MGEWDYLRQVREQGWKRRYCKLVAHSILVQGEAVIWMWGGTSLVRKQGFPPLQRLGMAPCSQSVGDRVSQQVAIGLWGSVFLFGSLSIQGMGVDKSCLPGQGLRGTICLSKPKTVGLVVPQKCKPSTMLIQFKTGAKTNITIYVINI